MKEPSKKQTEKALQKEDEQIEVSFATLTIDNPNDNEIIKKIATAINVQLSSTEGGQYLPFTAPKDFEFHITGRIVPSNLEICLLPLLHSILVVDNL
jgi:hypothetical protein